MTLSENERTLTSHQQPPYIFRLFFHFSCFLLLGEQCKAKQNKRKTNTTKTVPLGELYYPSSQSSSVDSLVIYSLLEDVIIASPPSSPLLLCLYCQSLLTTWMLSQHNVSYHFFLSYIRMINTVEFIASLLHLVFAMDILYADLLISLFPTLNPNKMGMIPGRRKNEQARVVDITYMNFGHSYA